LPRSELERFTQPAIGQLPRRFNVARGQTAAVTVDGELRELRWGLLAPWRGHGGKRPPPIYIADAALIDALPMLRRARRCVVHTDGFYAWHVIGAKRHAFWIHTLEPIAVIGLSATHDDDGIAAFAIAVGPAPPELRAITPIAPIVDGDARWRASEISHWFADASHDDERCIAPLRNPSQGELF
jgi:putative SOS response-associated peptidase YedK